ncbi:hypothetical protein H0I76_06250 [Limibaculum sp. M0105]|uniref:Uncharacterized protein n=1 Tax=Thermohalobaculum xanthum TaxID=2753746 RepID=A0A8J7M6J7_9RHOB|nr:hypothetical protein [Thermohalobaculum xanthum]MBK0398782.1 hypothetical protein [Thermohalobaculum xanthum]
MKPFVAGATAVFMIVAVLFAGGAFEREDSGSAEKAGEHIDKALKSAGDAAEKAAEKAAEVLGGGKETNKK